MRVTAGFMSPGVQNRAANTPTPRRSRCNPAFGFTPAARKNHAARPLFLERVHAVSMIALSARGREPEAFSWLLQQRNRCPSRCL